MLRFISRRRRPAGLISLSEGWRLAASLMESVGKNPHLRLVIHSAHKRVLIDSTARQPPPTTPTTINDKSNKPNPNQSGPAHTLDTAATGANLAGEQRRASA